MQDTGFSARTCREHLQRLESGGYISLERKTSGQKIRVRKSVKWLYRGESREASREKSGRAGKKNTALGSLLEFLHKEEP